MHSDKPITKILDDLFGRSVFAGKIARVIKERPEKDSFVISVNAAWGEGKTSLLNMVIDLLGDRIYKPGATLLKGDILVIKFNPWRYGDEAQLLRAYFEKVAVALEKSLDTKAEKIVKFVRKYSALTSIMDVVSLNVLGLELKPNVKDTVDNLTSLMGERDIDELKAQIEELLSESEFKILVLMDDVDRLNKDEIRSLFRLVKLTADFPNTIFLLAFDEHKVSDAINDVFGGEGGGRSFLEKIIQLPLILPPISQKRLVKHVMQEIQELFSLHEIEVSRNAAATWAHHFEANFGSLLSSPRAVLRYINNLSFSLPESKGEVNIFDLLTVEALRAFFPKVYEAVRTRRELFLQPDNFKSTDDSGRKVQDLMRISEIVPDHERENCKNAIVQLFPQARSVLFGGGQNSGPSDVQVREKRICTQEYFQRYFDHGVGPSDISDVELSSFISQFKDYDNVQKANLLEAFLIGGREQVFLKKLTKLIEAGDGDSDTVVGIAKLIAVECQRFKKESQRGPFGGDDFSLAGQTVAKLLKLKVVRDELIDEMLVVAKQVGSTDFLREIALIFNIEAFERGDPPPPIYMALAELAADRLVAETETEKLEVLYPERASDMLDFWREGNEATLIYYLKKRVKESPDFAAEFLLIFRVDGWGVRELAESFNYDFLIECVAATRELQDMNLGDHWGDLQPRIRSDLDYLSYFVDLTKKLKGSPEAVVEP